MDRRDALIALAALLAARAVHAQAPRPAHAALFLSFGAGGEPRVRADAAALFGAHGFVEGRNLTLSLADHGDRPAERERMARELVAGRPDVILVLGSRDALLLQRLTTSTAPQLANSVDPTGRFLVFHEGDPASGRQSLMMMTLERDGQQLKGGAPTTLVGGPFLKANARISPDGKWIAYAAFNSGAFEIYVQPFPGPGERVQVSSGGGNLALWSRTKNELFYAASGQGRLMVVPYESANGAFVPAKPRAWSETVFSAPPPFSLYGPGFDVHPDGTRFAVTPPMLASQPGRHAQIVLFFNFLDELRRLAPVR